MKTAKQFLSIFVAVLMVLSIVPVSGIANADRNSMFSVQASAVETFGDLKYSVSNGEVRIFCGNSSATGEVNIPATINGYPVTAIGDDAFSDYDGITSVVLPDSVKTIGDESFAGCPNLKTVTLGNSVETIDEYAFCDCTGLESINLPDSLKLIDDCAFKNCSSLKSVAIPASVTTINDEVFIECPSLESITVDAGNTVYDSRNNCNAVIETDSDTLVVGCKNTVIPDDIDIIGYSAFEGCDSLTSIVVPDSVTEIDDYAFDSCSGLETVTLGKGVSAIGESAFSECENLTDINLNNIVNIGSEAFWCCKKLNNVEFGSKLVTIGTQAFTSCESLTSVYIPAGVTSIMSGAFLNCSALENIKIDENNTIYDSRNNCNAIIETSTNKLIMGCKASTIPEGVTAIEAYAFYKTGLTNVNIPASLTSIGSKAFEDCPIASITIDENNTSFDSRDNCNAIIDTASNTLIRGCANTVIPDTVTAINASAFSNCTDLETVNIPDSVTKIGDTAFKGCSNLKSATIGSGVDSIGDIIFESCPSLTSIKVSEDNSKYDSRNNCNAIIETSSNTLIAGCKATVIPDTVKIIGKYAFYNCKALTGIEIPDSVTKINAYAFEWTGLTSVVIPDSVTLLDKNCFCDCKNLESITIGNAVEGIGDYAVFACDNLKAVYYHCTKSNIDGLAVPKANDGIFANKSSWTILHNYNEDSSTEATCASPATITYICSDCGDELVESDMSSLLPHTPSAAVTENNVAATCTKEGSYDSVVYCSVCKNVISRTTISVDKTVHTYAAVTVAPTCTAKGCTVHTCTGCKDTYIDSYVEALGHSFTSYTYNNDATCTADGTMTAKCDRCDATDTVTATGTAGHIDANNDVVCDRCGENLGGTTDSTACKHMCHSDNGFVKFFWKIFNFFNKLFKINQYCKCGAAHY